MGGVNGQGKQMDGADAPDLEIPVPAGTIIRRKVRVSLGVPTGVSGASSEVWLL